MGRSYPDYPIPSCHAMVRNGDVFLLVKRARPPLKGYWGLPGGGVELGETVEAAAIREVREETGLNVAVTRFLGYADAIDRDAANRVQWHYVIHYFEVNVQGGVLAPADDASEVRWVTPREALALPVTDAVMKCLAWSSQTGNAG